MTLNLPSTGYKRNVGGPAKRLLKNLLVVLTLSANHNAGSGIN
jgi:hypothetical protein